MSVHVFRRCSLESLSFLETGRRFVLKFTPVEHFNASLNILIGERGSRVTRVASV